MAALERLADCGVRFDLFRLATHYWEGRWICAMEELLPKIDRDLTRSGNPRTGKTAVVPRWRRRMMLTPCMVSTFATLPGKMTVSKPSGDGTFENEYLFNFIDLLIVDEAGQVQPEAAGGAFALARRALVIGDTQQIEPIASLPKSVDIGNLMESEVLSPDYTKEDLEREESLGVCSTGGSAMQVAQSACRYYPELELSRGLWLFEHRRCYDEIVEYCKRAVFTRENCNRSAAGPLERTGRRLRSVRLVICMSTDFASPSEAVGGTRPRRRRSRLGWRHSVRSSKAGTRSGWRRSSAW